MDRIGWHQRLDPVPHRVSDQSRPDHTNRQRAIAYQAALYLATILIRAQR
ncbi:hypothetical protein ACIG54_37395 [Streptomyces achromogenes]